MIFIAATRWTLRWISDMRRVAKIAAVMLVNCFAALVLTVGPLTLARHKRRHDFSVDRSWRLWGDNEVDALTAFSLFYYGWHVESPFVLRPDVRPLYALRERGARRLGSPCWPTPAWMFPTRAAAHREGRGLRPRGSRDLNVESSGAGVLIGARC